MQIIMIGWLNLDFHFLEMSDEIKTPLCVECPAEDEHGKSLHIPIIRIFPKSDLIPTNPFYRWIHEYIYEAERRRLFLLLHNPTVGSETDCSEFPR